MSVSIITACKNRKKPLSISVSSWIQFDEVDEVIITDWDSDESLTHLTKLSKKVKIISVKNEPYFNQPQPLNLAASLVKSEYLLKLDCDHILNPYWSFFDLHKIEEDIFISGCNSVSQKSMDAYFLYPLWGMLYVKNQVFKELGGYNEDMGKYYAVEDDELCIRLMSYGLKPKSINVQRLTALHIPHTDKNRVENFESFESIKDILSQKDLSEDKLYTYMAQLCRNKNHQENPIIPKMMSMFEEFKEFGKLSEDSLESLKKVDWYCKPKYTWELTQLTDQTYEAVKV